MWEEFVERVQKYLKIYEYPSTWETIVKGAKVIIGNMSEIHWKYEESI
jgi:hypothetical protein